MYKGTNQKVSMNVIPEGPNFYNFFDRNFKIDHLIGVKKGTR